METERRKIEKMPFAVSRSSRATLVAQVVGGIRSCIQSGFFKEGDVIPTTRDLAAMLGVSRIVTRAAVKSLTDAGLIIPRPRAGCVVLGRGEKLWKGNVLFVSPSDGRVYYDSVFSATLRTRLVKAGWLFSQVTAIRDSSGDVDVSELELHLKSPLSMAVSMFSYPAVLSSLSRSGTPFVAIGGDYACRLKGCIGQVRFNRLSASSALAAAANAAGVKTVLRVGCDDFNDIGAAFKATGIKVSKRIVQVPSSGRMPEAVAAAVCEEFLKKFTTAKDAKSFSTGLTGLTGLHSGAKGTLPDLIYFSDDFACAGALAAFSKSGVRVPEDVRVATWANAGNVPAFAGELTRVEMDPEGDAEKLADALIARLEGRDAAFPATFGPTFMKGTTL